MSKTKERRLENAEICSLQYSDYALGDCKNYTIEESWQLNEYRIVRK